MCFDLISKMLVLNPDNRYTCSELLNHEFFKDEPIMDNSQFKDIVGETHEYYIRNKSNNYIPKNSMADNEYCSNNKSNKDIYKSLSNAREDNCSVNISSKHIIKSNHLSKKRENT